MGLNLFHMESNVIIQPTSMATKIWKAKIVLDAQGLINLFTFQLTLLMHGNYNDFFIVS